MQRATITYGEDQLEAREQHNVWTVRLANLEVRARYLDLALAELLGNAPEAHRAAARLLFELADVVERQGASGSQVEPARRRGQPSAPPREAWPKSLLLSARALVFAVVASSAFMLTTWLTTIR
jgi:hypothetical protein